MRGDASGPARQGSAELGLLAQPNQQNTPRGDGIAVCVQQARFERFAFEVPGVDDLFDHTAQGSIKRAETRLFS